MSPAHSPVLIKVLPLTDGRGRPPLETNMNDVHVEEGVGVAPKSNVSELRKRVSHRVGGDKILS